MAIYTKPISISRQRGSAGGSTFQRTANGFVIRGRFVPVQKRSPIQTLNRNRFDSIAKRWKDLSIGDQATWDTEAPNYTRTDSLGNIYTITGQALQQSSNINLDVAAQPLLDSIPAVGAIPSIVAFTLLINYASNQGFYVTNPQFVPAGYELYIYATQPLANGITSPDFRTMRLITIFPAGYDTTIDDISFYKSIFPDTGNYAGLKIFAAAQYVQTSTGQRGPALLIRGVSV